MLTVVTIETWEFSKDVSVVPLLLASWNQLVLSSLIFLTLVKKCVYLTFSYCGHIFGLFNIDCSGGRLSALFKK